MPDMPCTSTLVAGSARELDVQCRGRDTSVASRVEPGMGRGRAMHRSAPLELPVDLPVRRPVVRDADRRGGREAERGAIVVAATEALRQDAAERVIESRPVPAADRSVAAPEGPSAELLRLLTQLRDAVTRFVCGRRDVGTPIERVLPEVKGLVREAVAHERWHEPAATLMTHVVGWTITAYYDVPAPAGSGRLPARGAARCDMSRDRA